MSLMDDMIESGVGVWHYPSQKFVPYVPCPGERRVRIDVYDSLDNYDVFACTYRKIDDENYNVTANYPIKPFSGWRIDLT